MRRLLWSAALLLALLAGCAAQETAGDAVQPVNFYYPRVTPAYGQADGCLAAEVYDWGAQEMDYLALLNRYLQGPVSEELRQPLPEGTAFLDVTVQAQCANVTANAAFATLSGSALSEAVCCLAKTLLELPGIQSVRLSAQNALLDGQSSLFLTDDSIILSDDGASTFELPMVLYFASDDGRYLCEQTLTVPTDLTGALPSYLIEQLIENPAGEGRRTLPADLRVLDTTIENGICTVDLSQQFLDDMPQTALEERLRVFSIVNTLTGIDNVDAVRILVSGAPVERYLYLDLQQDLVREPSIIAAAHPSLSTFDATLCLPIEGQSGLFACPIQLESRANEDPCRIVLDALLAYSGGNGYYNPLPAGLIIRAFSRENGVCYIDFSADPLGDCQDPAQMRQCVQAIVLSLRESVTSCLVQITVNGIPLQQLHALYTEHSRYYVPELSQLYR